jgi:hypothetical protein
MIGSSKFCLKLCGTGASCGVQAHEGKKFQVEASTFYLKENDSRAFIQPCFSTPALSPNNIELILQQSLTLKEWVFFFDELGQGRFASWLDSPSVPTLASLEPLVDLSENSSHGSFAELETPKNFTASLGIFKSYPSLSFDTDSDDEGGATSVTLEGLAKAVSEFHRRFSSLRSKWTHVFTEIESSHVSVVRDLKHLYSTTKSLKSTVGASPVTGGTCRLSLWDSVQQLSDSVTQKFRTLESSQETF